MEIFVGENGVARNDYLFNSVDWFSVDRNQSQRMLSEIDGVDAERLLNTSVGDLAVYFSRKYTVEVPVLDLENLTVDEKEKKIDVSGDPYRVIWDNSRPFYVNGSEVEVEIPFEGDPEVFKIQPTSYDLNPPRAVIRGQLLGFSVTGTNLNADGVRAEIDGRIKSIQAYLNTLVANAAGLNGRLEGEARSAIEVRRTKLLASRSMVSALGFKIKERSGAPKTFVPEDVRRKISPVMPPASTAPFKPEPVLANSDYEHILTVMQSMTQVMELSPSAFFDVDEEALRSHFLVQLNGHYMGQATGETFNYEGKTDILIRSDGRNIFIAECKFWSGPKMLEETIDQLLGYSSWRDTKAAIVVFNRNREFSRVLEKIPGVMRAHSQYKRDLPGSTETVFRYQFANRDDRNREIFLTVLAFDVPTRRA